ncbi:hypothetical protein GH714_013076 [Hevea brasiliensis]|uniref:Uncharacterized protein n=1 Tax=Hevea brasiliensis TaxID=3981 RepID=A0A6A6KZU9_HEVBR|nr:hypothetical protein GH714_013076 [Hevea brasiliensis]
MLKLAEGQVNDDVIIEDGREEQKDINEVQEASGRMKGKPIGSQENMRLGGMDASMRFEHNEIDSKYANSDELFSVLDSDGEGNVRIKVDLSFTIKPIKAWKAREFALKTINGEAKQYSRLHDHKLELLRTNPESTVEFKEEKGKFEGIYICLAAIKEAFKDGWRPLICVD